VPLEAKRFERWYRFHMERIARESPPHRLRMRWREGQTLDLLLAPAGWGYGRRMNRPYLSIAAGGLSSIAICRRIAGIAEPKRREEDPVLMGLALIAQAYSTGGDRRAARRASLTPSPWYSLYGIERAMELNAVETIDGHDWYRDGALWIIERLRDAPLGEDDHVWGEAQARAFGLLFLARSTGPWNLRPR
jgi:hypothetical protein